MCRLSFYLIIYLIVLSTSYLVFLTTNFSHTDVDSARYMLSALIQSEAAIIAIVVTMSLVAAQLAASLYSVRVTNIFRNSPDLWILMLIYGIVLFWGLGVLKLIEKADLPCASDLICQSNLQGHIALTYSLGIFAFVALAPYIWNIFGMLNASTITTKCAKNITKQSILKSTDDDSFLTIIDIMKSSLIKYDYGTLETGLKAIKERIGVILESKNLDADEEKKISDYIFEHLVPVGKLALSRSDEISINQVTNIIQEIGTIAVKNQCELMTDGALIHLRYIGREAVNRNLELPADVAITAIQNIGTIAVKNHYGQMANRAIEYLANIGISATKQKFESPARMAINAIEKISVDNEIHIPTIAAETGIFHLGNIGRVAIDNRLEGTTSDAALSLEKIGRIAAKNNRSNVILFVINTLYNMGNYATVKGLPNISVNISTILYSVCTSIPTEMKLEKKEALEALKMLKAFRLLSYKNS